MDTTYQHDRLYIGGQWAAPHGEGRIEVRSPSTEEVIGYVPDASETDVDRAVAAARSCFDESSWPHLSFAERAGCLRRAAKGMESYVDRLTQVLIDENGIPLQQARRLAARPLGILLYYAELGERLGAAEVRSGTHAAVTVRREPVGVAGIITPWNAPAPLAHFSVPAALLAGCAVVLRTPGEAPLHGQILGEIYDAVGLPPGALNILAARREVSATLPKHPGVDKISFTGSSATGRQIAATCGAQLKRCTLELGGKSAAIVLDDADLGAVMPTLVSAAIQNNAEACVGQTRILAPVSRYDEVVDAFVAELGRRKVGDPRDPEVSIGPLISEAQRERVERYIRMGIEDGATLVTGGRRADLPRGYYVEPTVFRDVDNSMRIAREEIFGPVFVVIPYTDDEDAVRIANDSEYGLSGTVWTSRRDRGMAIATKVRTGNFGVNIFMLELNSPFGGFKSSGIGRQLGPEGLQAFQELKSIHEPLPG